MTEEWVVGLGCVEELPGVLRLWEGPTVYVLSVSSRSVEVAWERPVEAFPGGSPSESELVSNPSVIREEMLGVLAPPDMRLA